MTGRSKIGGFHEDLQKVRFSDLFKVSYLVQQILCFSVSQFSVFQKSDRDITHLFV